MNYNLDMLSANLTNELDDAQLESVYGGFGGFGGFGAPGLGAPVLGAGSYAAEEHVHSFSVLCDVSVFSLAVNVLPILNIANPAQQGCINND